MGRSFVEIHAPVADNAALLTAGPQLAQLVTSGERWERFVWTVTCDPRLDRHPQRSPPLAWRPSLTAADLGEAAFLRSERQTFIPVPRARQAVFTILGQVESLAAAVTGADDAARLHDAIASMSPAVLAYRGLMQVRDRLLAWLEARGRR